VVVIYAEPGQGFRDGHERATREAIAERLAALKGFAYAGEYDPSARYGGPVYFLPSDTIASVEAARGLGIAGVHDLFGGVVPHPFVATKAITHPLLRPDAFAPPGWSHEFDRRVHGAVPFGFTAFTLEDARAAGARLLAHGPARIKPVRATAGRGQIVVSGSADLDAALAGIDPAELSRHGIVIEENLADSVTFSVGQVRVADQVASYYGTQRAAPDNSGEEVYAGSDLVVARGGFAALLALDLPEAARTAVRQARIYDAAAMELFPGLLASRRNYDVVQGLSPGGLRRSGVLEQSWRIGGASPAEVAALEAFAADPAARAVRAASVEIYGDSEPPPPHATVYFRGLDDRVGPLTKYATVAPL
jgi:hypothetical protein